jgi:NAD-reducing hydrogenase small subunit
MKKVKVATVWLDGCSGCHMSLLDMDALIISLATKMWMSRSWKAL